MNNIDILEEKEKKAIKDLKEISHYCSLRAIDIDDKYSDLWARYIVSIQIVKNLIETLISENKELKEKIKEINEEYNAEQKHEMENTIPKSKVEEKIKELEKQIEEMPSEINFSAFYRMKDLKNVEIGVLQSLLGKE